jgi:hypothetical protein
MIELYLLGKCNKTTARQHKEKQAEYSFHKGLKTWDVKAGLMDYSEWPGIQGQ